MILSPICNNRTKPFVFIVSIFSAEDDQFSQDFPFKRIFLAEEAMAQGVEQSISRKLTVFIIGPTQKMSSDLEREGLYDCSPV